MRPFGLAALLILPALASAQATTVNPAVKVKVIGGYLFCDVVVNGQPGHFVLDTGAGVNCLVPEFAQRIGLTKGLDIDATGVGSEPTKGRLVRMSSMKVGEVEAKNLNALVIDLPKILQCDGLIGYDFLKNFVTTIDYQRCEVVFRDPKSFIAPAGIQPVPLRILENHPCVEGSFEGFDGWFTLDTGAGGSISFFKDFLDRNGIREKYPRRLTTITGAGVGGFTTGELAKVHSIVFAGAQLPDVIADFSSNTKGAFASKSTVANVGHDILSKFVFTLDYKGGKAYFRRSPDFTKPCYTARSGLVTDYDGRAHRVVRAEEGTPASEAGFLPGDVLLEVDGTRLDHIHPLELKAQMRKPAGSTLRILVDRNGERKTLRMTLRDLLG